MISRVHSLFMMSQESIRHPNIATNSDFYPSNSQKNHPSPHKTFSKCLSTGGQQVGVRTKSIREEPLDLQCWTNPQKTQKTHANTHKHKNTYSKKNTHTKHTHTQQQLYNLERLFFNRGAYTPLWGVEAWSLPSRRPNPIPAIPPYVVKTPHLHGAPTTEETSFVEP